MTGLDLPEDRRLPIRDIARSGWLLPTTDPVSAVYFAAAWNGHLLIEACPACGRRQHYPRGICTGCGQLPTWMAATGTGVIHTFTVVRQNGLGEFKDQLPYVLALIDLQEGPRVMGNILGCGPDEVGVGSPVRAFIVRIAPHIGLPQWELT